MSRADDATLLRPFRPMLWLVAAAVFMQMLDTTIVNTALPAMAADLGQSPLRMQSVVVAYALTVAMLIPSSGWLADRIGTRRLFVAAILLFSAGSLACAASRSLDALVAARVLQGIGGAMLLPVGRLAVLRAVPRSAFLAAMTFVTVPGLVGPLIGPALGGWLTDVASWHWIFLINLPLGVVGGIAALKWMPDLRAPVSRFDGAGYALLAFGMIAVSLSVDALSGHSPRRAALVVLLVAGLVALVAYWLHAARAPAPLFPLTLFRTRTFSIGLLGNLFARLGSSGMPYMIPLLLQVALGFPATQAGLMMVPVAIAGMFSKRIVVPLVQRFGYRNVLVVNTVLTGLTMASFALVEAGQPLWLHLLQFAVFGAVNSLQFTAMNTLALRDLDGSEASAGNSLLSMVMMLAMSLGVATAGGLLGAFSGGEPAGTAPMLSAFRWTFVCIGALTLASAAIFAQLGRTRRISERVVDTADQA
ncbi:MFS transporter [Luteimonas chenhongjianii]|uniref:MFS transporter n=1 Tax=Luteimonas chenhongjianii TaxID=2006110 RepID=A0A290XDL1_9GAMM|nr:multidrug transporter subunit MdtD [Luteimonas chenhongjianii]ATD67161.1 MFS transporter [Luteimonas chenhongjianii]